MNFKNFSVQRRQLLQYGGAFLGTSLTASILGQNLLKPEVSLAGEPQILTQNKDLTPDQALTRLIEGNERFISQKRKNPNQTTDRLREISESQAPFAAILGCADSRVPSEMVFDQGLGDLFVCRIAGNIAVPEQIGSLEFGSMVLGAKLIMVLGHSRCGAVKAAIEGGRFPGQIGTLIGDLSVGVERASRQPGNNKLEAAIKANILHQVEVLSRSTILGDLIDKKQLKIVGGYYDLDNGKVTVLS